jgi:hypothetical protein
MASAVPQAPAPMTAIFRLKLGVSRQIIELAVAKLAALLLLAAARTWLGN